MCQHFVIGGFVPFRGLDHPVERQNPAEKRRFEDDQILQIGIRLVQNFGDLETLFEGSMERLGEPARCAATHSTRPLFVSDTEVRDGLKRSSSTVSAFSGRQLPHMNTSKAA